MQNYGSNDDADTRRKPDVDKNPAKNGPQRPVCSHQTDDEGPLQETHRGKSRKGKLWELEHCDSVVVKYT